MKSDSNKESVYDKLLKKRTELNTSEGHHKLVERDISIIDKLLSSPSRAEHISGSKKYLIDEKNFSRNPTAICGCIELGFPACDSGEGKYCYRKKICEFMTKPDGSGQPVSESAVKQMLERQEMAYEQSSSKYDPNELDRFASETAYSLVTIEGKKLRGEEI